jgi:hypothetical protein
MSRIIIYVDNAEVDNLKSDPSYSFSGDFILAGRDPEIADKARKIQLLLELLLDQMGDNPTLEFRRRSE